VSGAAAEKVHPSVWFHLITAAAANDDASIKAQRCARLLCVRVFLIKALRISSFRRLMSGKLVTAGNDYARMNMNICLRGVAVEFASGVKPELIAKENMCANS